MLTRFCGSCQGYRRTFAIFLSPPQFATNPLQPEVVQRAHLLDLVIWNGLDSPGKMI
jgi:hypothetical protein